MKITLTVNGDQCTYSCQPHESLRAVLRREGFFSVRFGAETGETGADAVLLNGRLVSSEILLAAQADGHTVETLEGLNLPRGLHPIQEAFVATGAIQSGYSTPATILAAKALIDRNPNPTEAEVRDALSGILDRETGYLRPVHAVLRAAAMLRRESVAPVEPTLVQPLVELGGTPDMAAANPTLDLDPVAPRVVPSPEVPDTNVVGKPERKVDAIKLAKGNPAFVDDIEMRGMLYAKMLYSPHAHARIVAIDDSKARALPGVRAVLHHENTSRVRYASGGQSYPNPLPYDQVSFDNKVRHVGDRVAVVAADTIEIAEQAVALIDVTYKVLPAVFDENEAISGDAPVIHDEADMEGAHDVDRNIVTHIDAEVGNFAVGLAGADRVFEKTFRVHQVQQAPIEPHIAIAWLDSDERMVIRTSTQVPFHVRRMVAPLLGMPVRDIRIVKPRIGGGFGVKQEMLIEDIVGHLALATGKPVRLELNRQEEFVSSRTRHPQTITFTTGVSNDGTLVAQRMRTVGNTGPYGTHALTVQMVSGLRGLSTYNCPNKKFDCDVAYTNTPVAGAYRGYGAPQALFALESHMDDIAAELGMDVLEFRRKNWTKVGDPLDVAGELGEGAAEMKFIPVVTSSGMDECVVQGQRAVGWHRRNDPAWVQPADRPNIRRGLGFAMCMHGSAISGLDMGGASIKINDDGSFNLLIGATDLGTGADTILAQMAAEVLGVPTEEVVVYAADTDMTPFDVGAYASSTTYVSGMAVKKAADEVHRQVATRAAIMLDIDSPGDIELKDKAAYAPDGRSVTLAEVALHSLHQDDQHQIMATASYVAPDSPPPYAAQFAEIEVDVETGQVTVENLVMAVDCGVPINPLTSAGQVEGGMVQALGYGHCEEMALDETGRMVNARFGPYKIYRADEMPKIEAYMVQTMEKSGPFGAKAIAEIPKDGVAPAIRNAIVNATGTRIDNLPFTPERVWRAMQIELVVNSADNVRILQELNAAIAADRPVVLATIVATRRSVPRHAGTKMLVFADGSIVGTVGGGVMESKVIAEAQDVIQRARPGVVDYELVNPSEGDPGICGGELTLYLEPYMPPHTVIVIGCGHVGRTVVDLAHWLGYRTVAIDDRPDLVSAEAMPNANIRFAGTVADALAEHPVTEDSSIIVVTRSPELDARILPELLATPARYVGVMGSRKRWKATRDQLVSDGVDEATLDQIHVPIGIDLNAETLEEIAVSILSEVIRENRTEGA